MVRTKYGGGQEEVEGIVLPYPVSGSRSDVVLIDPGGRPSVPKSCLLFVTMIKWYFPHRVPEVKEK